MRFNVPESHSRKSPLSLVPLPHPPTRGDKNSRTSRVLPLRIVLASTRVNKRPRFAELAQPNLPIMDSGRRDARGGRAPRRNKRARKLVLVVLQNLLIIACLLLALGVYWRNAEERGSEAFVHIRFLPLADIVSNGTLRFQIHSTHQMNLNEEKDRIYVSCTGPYILYIDMCYVSINEPKSGGRLQLRSMGKTTPASSFTLNATSVASCDVLHSIVHLKAKEQASLHLAVTGGFKVKNMTVALSYLLGGRCDF